MTRTEALEAWRDEVAKRLTETDSTYEAISREMGCTTGTVYALARKLGLRRQADKKAVANA